MRDRRPRVFAEKCATCIFRPGNRMQLREGRLREVVEANRRNSTALVCHLTTYGQRPDLGEVLCRGFFDAYGQEVAAVSVMVRLFGPDVFEEVPVPAED